MDDATRFARLQLGQDREFDRQLLEADQILGTRTQFDRLADQLVREGDEGRRRYVQLLARSRMSLLD